MLMCPPRASLVRLVLPLSLWAVSGLPAAAGPDYDGRFYFSFDCQQIDGRPGTWENSGVVKDGKFKIRNNIRRGEGGCKIDGCWSQLQGNIDADGRYHITYQENPWDRNGNGLNTWSVVGQFTTHTAGQATVTDYPRWIAQCKQSNIKLIEPAPESLAGRETASRTAAAAANSIAQGKSAELLTVKTDALNAMMEANLLLPALPLGPDRSVIEVAIQSLTEAIKEDVQDPIRSQTKLLLQLIQTARQQNPQNANGTTVAANQSSPSDLALSQNVPQKRVALVIGNSAYRNAAELPNPRNDARAISTVLRGLSFDVIEGEDLTKTDMEEKLRTFADSVKVADLALFFYAGHGMQVGGKNYLIPIDAKLENATAIDFETIDADRVLGYMADERRVSIALLDACRDNPLSRQFARSLGATRSGMVVRGLAPLAVSGGGLLVGFATSPGDVALDGDGGNSPFTRALITHLADKGLEIEQVLKRVKVDVIKATQNKQRPWINSDIASDVYLNP